MRSSTDIQYQTHILPQVSRTFALTIPQLPEPLCTVVSNAYLLCRIADTIEDDAALDAEHKTQFAEQFIQVVAGEADAEEFGNVLAPLLAPQTLQAERDLIANTDAVIRLTHHFTPHQQKILLRCVRIMSKGMADFQRNASPYGLQDMAEMDLYCYYVAGVVGEMLAGLFCDYSKQIAEHEHELLRLSVSFGQGLQMTNILKDILDDRQRNACWLPRNVFAQAGFDLQDLSADQYRPAFAQGMQELLGIAREHLHNAQRYVSLLPKSETGIRRFCLWAIGMAVLTLCNIEQHYRQHAHFHTSEAVKISRFSVKSVIAVSNVLTSQDWALAWLFKILSRSLPVVAEIKLFNPSQASSYQ